MQVNIGVESGGSENAKNITQCPFRMLSHALAPPWIAPKWISSCLLSFRNLFESTDKTVKNKLETIIERERERNVEIMAIMIELTRNHNDASKY